MALTVLPSQLIKNMKSELEREKKMRIIYRYLLPFFRLIKIGPRKLPIDAYLYVHIKFPQCDRDINTCLPLTSQYKPEIQFRTFQPVESEQKRKRSLNGAIKGKKMGEKPAFIACFYGEWRLLMEKFHGQNVVIRRYLWHAGIFGPFPAISLLPLFFFPSSQSSILY